MHEATKVLRQEHEVILRVLDATERAATSLESGATVPSEVLTTTVEFLKLYADRQHHGKEEDLLFPALEKNGMPSGGGPVAVMLMEHQMGRSHIARMADAAEAYKNGDHSAGAEWADAALDYVALLREHIAKENDILFVMAEHILSAADQQRLATEFAGVDKNKMGAGEGERLLRLADQLTADASHRVPA
jgi:hemerythrin-like domain-containing protein